MRRSAPRVILLILLALFVSTQWTGCAGFFQKKNNNPLDELTPSDQLETVVLFSTGNLQGALLPPEPGRGGVALVESYYKTTQKDFSKSLLWLDSGNLRSKTPQDQFQQGRVFEDFIAKSGISVTLDGTEKKVSPSPDSKNTQISAIELQRDSGGHTLLPAGRVLVGIISAGSREQAEKEATAARSEGAQLLIWLSQLSIHCSPHLDQPPTVLLKPGQPDGFCEGPLNTAVTEMAPGTFDAVITSGGDEPVQQYLYPRFSADPVAGTPVVQATPFGKGLDLIYLAYDLKKHRRVFEKTRIEGPIVVMENGGRFHDHEIHPDSEVVSLSQPAREWLDSQEKLILAQTSRDIAANPRGESPFGDLVADAVRIQTQSDFSLIHPGLVKNAVGSNSIHPGAITQSKLIRALPADGPIVVISVTGEELKQMIQISENGSRGFASVSGLKLRLIKPDLDAKTIDFDGNHHFSLWEQNRLIEMATAVTDKEDDDTIHTRRTYKLAVPEFLVNGGDDWKWLSQHFALSSRIDPKTTYPSTRALVASYLKAQGKIDSIETRIRFETPSKGKAKKKKARRRKHAKKPHSA